MTRSRALSSSEPRRTRLLAAISASVMPNWSCAQISAPWSSRISTEGHWSVCAASIMGVAWSAGSRSLRPTPFEANRRTSSVSEVITAPSMGMI
jgi:hypothetical protein